VTPYHSRLPRNANGLRKARGCRASVAICSPAHELPRPGSRDARVRRASSSHLDLRPVRGSLPAGAPIPVVLRQWSVAVTSLCRHCGGRLTPSHILPVRGSGRPLSACPTASNIPAGVCSWPDAVAPVSAYRNETASLHAHDYRYWRAPVSRYPLNGERRFLAMRALAISSTQPSVRDVEIEGLER
jgi:hypothetical protein